MMPSEIELAYWARRLDSRGYVEWLADKTGLPVYEDMIGKAKNVVDEHYRVMLNARPAWVDAAEQVLEAVVDEPEQPDVPEEEPDVPEEEPDAVTDEEQPDVPEEEESEDMIVPEADNPFSEQDYDSMTVKELQEECRQRGLTIRGTKAEVVLRLRRDDEGIVEQETEDETEAPSEEAAEVELDAPSEESEAVTEEVTDNDNSGETSNTDEEE